jgi:hypothetical protein
MKKINKSSNFFLGTVVFSISIILCNACSKEVDMTEVVLVEENYNFAPADWSTETHSKDVAPNFDEVFIDNTVKRLDFVITAARWQSMLDDMTATFGSLDSGAQGLIDTEEDPIFVPGEVFYEGKEWYRVGLRFKGNSSLQGSWNRGILKLSFKLDFDEFEDDYPQIKNQRFYGFKKFSLKNNYNDDSMLREKVATDVFRNAGLVASHTAFYTLYVDHGDGPRYFGLYTLVEEVDGTVLDTQFSDDDGNLYKPDGDAASFALGTYNEDEYVKKTNEDEADFSDVANLLEILHDNSRITAAATWRENLETIFDIDVFLKFLATNTVIENWDTYGRTKHNYYLYNNPNTNKLTWIPWDNNRALQEGRLGSPELDFSDVSSSECPLIGYLYEDAVYREKYDTYVQQVIDGAFNENSMQSLYTNYANLIEEYAISEVAGYTFLNSSADFLSAINELKLHVTSRKTAVDDYLN